MAKTSILAAACFCLGALGTPAQAAPIPPAARAAPPPVLIEPIQYRPADKKFRRCMRAKYGPRYFSRVPGAYRWHMAQACL